MPAWKHVVIFGEYQDISLELTSSAPKNAYLTKQFFKLWSR